MTFQSFIPTPLTDVQLVHTEELDRLIADTSSSLQAVQELADQLPDETLQALAREEAEFSCKLALGEQPISFAFTATADPALTEDTANLLRATRYAFEAMDELPLSARLLTNAHYLLCQSNRYARKYPGEFRRSPVWIGWKDDGLKGALFVPPVYEEMTDAFSDLEHYIHYTEEEPVLVRAALIHYQFEAIHPFIDGNGRIGRLLNALYLKQQAIVGYPIVGLSQALYKRAAIYYRELQRVNETGRYERWVNYFLESLKTAAETTLRTLPSNR